MLHIYIYKKKPSFIYTGKNLLLQNRPRSVYDLAFSIETKVMFSEYDLYTREQDITIYLHIANSYV